MSSCSPQLSPATHANLTREALTNSASVIVPKLPLMPSDAECFDHELDAPDDEPPSKKKKIVPYKLKETDKKMIYESGTVIYTEEFKRSVWDYLLTHTLAQGEIRYPEISHSVLYKWRRKALEEKGAFVPQRHVESRKSLLSDLRKDRDDEDSDEKQRRYSEPLKVMPLKIRLNRKEEPKVKLISALSDDMSVDKKVRVVVFALQNSTQKAAEHFNLRAGEVHSFMSQNVIRRMALDRINNKVSRGLKSEGRTEEEVQDIVNLARKTSVERAARQFGVKEGQIVQWMRSGSATRNAVVPFKNGSDKGQKKKDYDVEFQMKVLDLARKQSMSRACKVYQVQPGLVQEWMRHFFPEDEVHRVVRIDNDVQPCREEKEMVAPVDADELERLLYERLQQPSSRIRALDTGGMDMETVVSVLKVALTAGSKVASLKFNIPRTTIATWITRNSLEELTKGARSHNDGEGYELRRSNGSASSISIVSNGHSPSPVKAPKEPRPIYRAPIELSPEPSPLPMANGDEMEMDELMDSNNNTIQEKEEIITRDDAKVQNGVICVRDEKSVSLSKEQIEQALELGISMKCLLRWLECRDHFMKTRKGRLESAGGNCLRELLTFRLEAVDYSEKEGRVFAASIFRVTLSELNEWTKRRDAYMKVLLDAPYDNSRALEVVEKTDLFTDAEHRARAQALAEVHGIDLNATNQFIQQLYASY